jgi:hypothetical protein
MLINMDEPKPTVIVVDDLEVLALTGEMLQSAGYEVVQPEAFHPGPEKPEKPQ